MAYIIRTSDRIQFKKCRRAWDIGSKIRQNLEPKKVRTPLDFGTEIHAGCEAWYDPKLWDTDPTVQEQLSLLAFNRSWKLHWQQYEADGVLSEETKADMEARLILGTGMLKNYFQWSKINDRHLTPTHTEIEFEVPITVPPGFLPPIGFERTLAGYLTHYGIPVLYQGRIDLIVRDEYDRYWIVDHKTAARLVDNTSFLELDEQMKSYAWAIQKVLGIRVAGVLYNELYKGIPEAPARLKSTRKGLSFSTSKSADTTFELALETFRKYDTYAFKHGMYDEYLTYLKNDAKQFVRRTPISYTSTMLDNLGDQICLEAIDMLNDPMVYPNPTKFGCDWCDHRMLCLAMNDGQPEEWIKETFYNVRIKTHKQN